MGGDAALNIFLQLQETPHNKLLKERTKVKLKVSKLITLVSLITLLSACGDGGGGISGTGLSDAAVKSLSVSSSTPSAASCSNSFSDTDAFGNIQFQPSTGTTPWGCLVVDQSSGQPVVSGTKSVRVELRPGDCDSSQTFLSGSTVVSDCTSDRSRFEIMQRTGGSTAGQFLTFEYSVFIPAQSNFQPPWKGTGSPPLTVLSQINWQCFASPCPTLGSNGYGALAYLVIDSTGTLFVQTHKDFTWVPNHKIAIDSNPFDKWIKLKYFIKSSSSGDGVFWFYANDKLILGENRATLPNPYAFIYLKLGIYNSSISSVSKPWSTQVIYYDAVSTKVENY